MERVLESYKDTREYVWNYLSTKSDTWKRPVETSSETFSESLLCVCVGSQAFQDGLACARRRRELPALAVSWGTWASARRGTVVFFFYLSVSKFPASRY